MTSKILIDGRTRPPKVEEGFFELDYNKYGKEDTKAAYKEAVDIINAMANILEDIGVGYQITEHEKGCSQWLRVLFDDEIINYSKEVQQQYKARFFKTLYQETLIPLNKTKIDWAVASGNFQAVTIIGKKHWKHNTVERIVKEFKGKRIGIIESIIKEIEQDKEKDEIIDKHLPKGKIIFKNPNGLYKKYYEVGQRYNWNSAIAGYLHRIGVNEDKAWKIIKAAIIETGIEDNLSIREKEFKATFKKPRDKVACRELIRKNFAGYDEDVTNKIMVDIQDAFPVELEIWAYDKNGKAKLQHSIVAHNILLHESFITIGNKVTEMYYYNGSKYVLGAEGFIGELVQDETGGYCKNYDIREIIGHIQRNTLCTREIFDIDTRYINFHNGIYDLKESKLLPHNREMCFLYEIPHNYDSSKDCSNFKKLLEKLLEKEYIPIIQEFLGFCLYRRYFIKKAIMFKGKRDTGKTTLIKVIVDFIGVDNTSGVSLYKIISDRFASSHLYQKHLNFYDDLSYNDVKETGAFKVAVGNGYLSAERKFGENFEFLNYSKLLFAANKIPSVKHVDDDAYFDRWIIIPFNHQIPRDEQDGELLDKLLTPDEFSGIINFALEGLYRLLKEGRFSYNFETQDIKEVMERDSCSVALFIYDCLEEKPGGFISKEDLYKKYEDYINSKKEDIGKETKENFGRIFKRKCKYVTEGQKDIIIDLKKKKGVHGWNNVSIK